MRTSARNEGPIVYRKLLMEARTAARYGGRRVGREARTRARLVAAFLAASIVATLSLTSPLCAQSYVQNGEFQSGKLAPWTIVGKPAMLGHRIDRGFYWLNDPRAGLRFTGLSQRLWLPPHDGLWMLSLECYGGLSACHFYRISLDNQVLRQECVGRDALRQWILPLSPGAHRLEILATQFGTTEASLVRRANLTKVVLPHAILNQYRATRDEFTLFARPLHFTFVLSATRRSPSGRTIPGVEGLLWLALEGPSVTLGPFLSPPSGVARVPLDRSTFSAARGAFLQVLSVDPKTMRMRLGTRNWVPR